MNGLRLPDMIKWALTGLVCFCCNFCFTQNRELDSLTIVFASAKEDTVKLRALKRMVFLWHDINADSAKAYIRMLRSHSEKAKFPEGIIYADVKMAELYNYSGEFAMAMELNNSNLAYAFAKGTPYQQADVYKTLAMTFSMQGKNDSALHHYLSALRIYDEGRDSLNMAKVMVNIGVVHENMGDHEKAIGYCKKSKQIFKNRDRNAYRVTLTNLALYLAYNKQYDEAKENFKEALAIAEQDNNYNSLGHIYSGLTDIAYWQKQYPLMITYAREFMRIAEVMQFSNVLLKARLAMGKALFFNERFQEAETYLTDALQRSDNLEDVQLLKDLYSIYSYLLLRKGNLRDFDLYRQKIDSLTIQERKDVITRTTKELEAQYETEKKDNLIQLQSATLRQRQLWNYFLAAIILSLGLIVFFIFRNYRQRQKLTEKEKILQQQKIEQLEKEKQLAATQAVLQGQDEERRRLAKDLHDGLGGMLSGVKFSFNTLRENMNMTEETRQTFARNMDMLDSTIYELRRVAHNMMPESLIKFGLDSSLQDMCHAVEETGTLMVNYQSMGIEGHSVDNTIAVHIYRMVQELLNNVMKHAQATEAFVQVMQSKGHFTITVEDNGKGFDTSGEGNPVKPNGMGWMNIRSRVDLLNGLIDIKSAPQNGTSVYIEFNI